MSNHFASSIKRIYDDCHRAIVEKDVRHVGKAIVDRHNELLQKAKSEYPDNEIIQELDKVQYSGSSWTAGNPTPTTNDLQDVKFNVTSIADAIGLDLNDFRQTADTDSLPVIKINQVQNQTQQQSATQTVTIDQLYEHAEGMMAREDEKEKLRNLVERFEDELESEDPDAVKLRDVVDSAKSFSSQLAMKMAMAAFERGVDLLVE